MALNKINIADNKLEADLIPVSQNHIAYLNPNLDDKHHFVRRKYLNNAIMEVHLYHPETLDSNQTHLSVPVSTFNRMDVYEFDQEATSSNRVLSIVGISGITAFVGLFVYAAAAGLYWW